MRLLWKIIIASVKMYARQKEALLWSVLLPLFITGLFSLVRFDGMGNVAVSVVDESGDEKASQPLVEALGTIPTVRLMLGSREAELGMLKKGERDIVLVIPRGFVAGGRDSSGTELTAFVNQGRAPQVQVGLLILQRCLDEIVLVRQHVAGRVRIASQNVESRNLTYLDFLLPGIIAMSIMQLGVFGVAFNFVSLKKRGILRRLSATPLRPRDFIVGQVVTRVLVVMLQIGIMVGMGMAVLHFHFSGNLFTMFLVGVLGSVVFLGVGFAIAGVSKSEDQVAPLANIVTMPMLFLSGVFFSRSTLPAIARHVTDLFPLSFLADALRDVAIEGASLLQVLPSLAGLVVWGIITCAIAIRLFRWE